MRRRRTLLLGCVALASICSRSGVAQNKPGATDQPDPQGRIDPAVDTGLLVRPEPRVGDEWVYRRSTGRSSRLVRQSITGVNETGMTLKTEEPGSPDSSVTVHDRHWGLLGSGFNDYSPALAYYSFPLYSGKRWGLDSKVSNFGAGQSGRMKGEGHARGWETVEVPAGRFLAMKIEVTIETADPEDAKRTLVVRERHWYARAVLRPVRVESDTSIVGEAPRNELIELMSFRLE